VGDIVAPSSYNGAAHGHGPGMLFPENFKQERKKEKHYSDTDVGGGRLVNIYFHALDQFL